MTTFHVTHRTEYTYESDVTSSYGVGYLVPRAAPWQTCRSADVQIDPAPQDRRTHTDTFGNLLTYFSTRTAHRRLEVVVRSVVDVERADVTVDLATGAGSRNWEETAEAVAHAMDPAGLEARRFLGPSPMIELDDGVRAFGAASFAPGRPIVEVLRELNASIHRSFLYRPGATHVGAPLSTLLAGGEGVCQDFAHLAVACLRSYGVAARYVSGYLETDPPPGGPRLIGADESHAWAAAYVPGLGWLDIDPTNDCFVGNRHITTAWGRDYSDVPPLKGVVFTECPTGAPRVSVDVHRAPVDQAVARPA